MIRSMGRVSSYGLQVIGTRGHSSMILGMAMGR